MRRVDQAGPVFKITSLNPMQNFRCVHMRGRAGSVPGISVFPTGISLSGLENFAI